jgi:hypothetical protein
VPAAVADNLAASPDMVQSQGAPQGAASLQHSAVPQAMRSTLSAQGGLLRGAKVSGSFTFDIGGRNYFDYTQSSDVPAGYSNSSPNPPTDIPVNDTKIEFGYLHSMWHYSKQT